MNITDPISSRSARTSQAEIPRLSRMASRLPTQQARFSDILQEQAPSPGTAKSTTPAAPAAASPAASTPAPKPAASTQASPTPAAQTPATQTNVFALVTATQPASAAPAPAAPAPEAHPTAESVFGSNPWMQSVGGYSSGGGSYTYNSMYFATKETAEKVAEMLGGKVVAQNAMVGDTGPFFQQQPNYMVQLPNGHLVNAGLTASYFTHGWSQSFIDTMLGYDRNV